MRHSKKKKGSPKPSGQSSSVHWFEPTMSDAEKLHRRKGHKHNTSVGTQPTAPPPTISETRTEGGKKRYASKVSFVGRGPSPSYSPSEASRKAKEGHHRALKRIKKRKKKRGRRQMKHNLPASRGGGGGRANPKKPRSADKVGSKRKKQAQTEPVDGGGRGTATNTEGTLETGLNRPQRSSSGMRDVSEEDQRTQDKGGKKRKGGMYATTNPPSRAFDSAGANDVGGFKDFERVYRKIPKLTNVGKSSRGKKKGAGGRGKGKQKK